MPAPLDAGRIAELEQRLGHRFHHPEILERALTHASFGEGQAVVHNEALAFLGDAALGLVVTEQVFRANPEHPVGVLTPERAALVSGACLARWAAALDLGPLLRLGKGADLMGERSRESILATALEAVLGVVYLEGGLEAVRQAVARLAAW